MNHRSVVSKSWSAFFRRSMTCLLVAVAGIFVVWGIGWRLGTQAVNAATPTSGAQSGAVRSDPTLDPIADKLGSSASSDGARSPLVARGKELFIRQCAVCHGDAGDGAGKFAYLMNPRPRNLQQGDFKLATTQNQVPSDEDLIRTISRGMPGSAMPPWGHLPVSDLQALAAYVREFRANAVRDMAKAMVSAGKLEAQAVETYVSGRVQAGALVVVPPEPIQNDIRWFNGRRLYLEGCASCHGVDGHGFGLHGSALSAKEMGGILTAHSDGPNCGATFTLELFMQRAAVT